MIRLEDDFEERESKVLLAFVQRLVSQDNEKVIVFSNAVGRFVLEIWMLTFVFRTMIDRIVTGITVCNSALKTEIFIEEEPNLWRFIEPFRRG